MSKSVDETVFDYFSLLLAEPEPQVAELPANASKSIEQRTADAADEAPVVASPTVAAVIEENVVPDSDIAKDTAAEDLVPTEIKVELVAPVAAPKRAFKPEVKTEAATPTIDRQALEKLLSSVIAENKQKADTAIDAAKPAIKVTKTAAKVQPKVEVNAENVTKVAEKIAEKPTAAIIKEQQNAKVDRVAETVAPATQTAAVPPTNVITLEQQLDDEFQVLFFKVAGLTLAVPLISLGGIVQIEHINHIFGRPKWYKGVQTYRESQLNVVDTAAWVMPEKYDDKLAQSINYQYLVVLENSNWGLACESLLNAVKIDKSQVNWRGKAGKRPWLAGVVKEQMCGILHVQALMEMLDAGLGCQDPIN